MSYGYTYQVMQSQLAIEIWANLLQPPETLPSSCFKVVQLDPILEPLQFTTNHFQRERVFSPSKPKKVPQKPTKRVWNWGQMFSVGFFLYGFRGNQRSTWMLDSEKVFKGYCRSLEAPRNRVVMMRPQSTGVMLESWFRFLVKIRLVWFKEIWS